MLDPFPATPTGPITCLPLWPERVLLPGPGPEEGLATVPTHILPNKLASVFRSHKKKTRKKNKHSRKSRRANR